MENKNIILITCAIFSIVILISQNNIDKVFALSQVSVNLNNSTNDRKTQYVVNGVNHNIFTVGVQGGVTNLYRVNADTNLLASTTEIKLKPAGISQAITPIGFTKNGAEVSVMLCRNVSTCSGGAFDYQFQRYNGNTGAFIDYINNTRASAISQNSFTGYSGTIYFYVAAGTGSPCSSAQSQLYTYDLQGGLESQIGLCALVNLGGGNLNDVRYFPNFSGANRVIYGSSGEIGIINLSTQTKCANAGASFNLEIDSNNNVVYSSAGSTSFKLVNSVCTTVNTVSSCQSACSSFTAVSNPTLNPTTKILYVIATNTANPAVIVAFNASSTSTITNALYSFTFTNPDTPAIKAMVADNINNQVAYSTSGKMYIECIDKCGSANTPTGSTVCIDTNGDNQTDLCFTDTNGDGVADAGPAGALGAQRSSANLTDFGSQVYCAFGINPDACTNKDVRTNGVGLMYLFLIIIFSYAVLVTIHHEAQKHLGGKDVQVMDALKINPLLLIIMLIIDIGFTWYLHWISDIIFYTMVVVMAGITAFGIYRQVKGGSE